MNDRNAEAPRGDGPPQVPTDARVPQARSLFREGFSRAFGAERDPAVELRREPGDSVQSVAFERIAKLRAKGDTQQRYLMLDEIGRGGMGAVLRVFDADLRRELAMKVVLGARGEVGEDTTARETRQLVRFLEEAQLTGQLDHPGVVPVHELGIDPEARVYFTMRLVKGEDLSKILAKVRDGDPEWSRTRVLGVLLKVCEAMSYAHEKGVVHRDLKPANVMVGRHGAVYVMDWGVARVEGREDARDLRPQQPQQPSGAPSLIQTDRHDSKGLKIESQLLTMDGDVLGTPYYMPPEQAAGRLAQIGPPSDVYALGAMLYHLLTGRMPYDAASDRVSPYTILARVLDGPPQSIQELAPDVPPELVSICEKAMAREPRDRYADMGELSQDLRAYLEDRVVRAHRTGAVIELQKWVRRNKALAGMILALVALTVGGSTTAALVLSAKNDEVRRARDGALAAQGLAESAAASEARQRALAEINERRAREAEQRAIQEAELAGAAEARAEARAAELAQVADFQAAQLGALDVHLMGARLRSALIAAAPAERRAEVARELEGVNFTSVALGSLQQNLFDRTIAAIDAQFADQPVLQARLLQTVAATLAELGLLEQARDPQERALSIRRAELGAEHPDTLLSLGVMGSLLQSQGKLAEAEPYHREALAAQRRVLGDEHPDTLVSINNMGGLHQARGEFAEAERYFREALEGRRRALGDEHPRTLLSIHNLGGLLQSQRELEQAEALYREAVTGQRRVLGDDDPLTLAAIDNLGALLQSQGKLEEAKRCCREALDGRRRVLGDEHPDTLVSIHNMGYVLHSAGEFAEAERHYREAFDGQRRVLGAEHPSTLWTRGHVLELYPEWIALLRAQSGDGDAETLRVRRRLAVLTASSGPPDEAEAQLQACFDARIEALGDEDPESLESLHDLATFYARRGRTAEAEGLFRECVDKLVQVRGESHPSTLDALDGLTRLLVEERAWSQAEPLARRLVALTPKDSELLAARRQLLLRIESSED